MMKSFSFNAFSTENPPANAVYRWSLKKQQKQNAFHGNEWMKEHTLHALHSRYTSSAKYDAKHMYSYLDFRCYFEANGQNHIHFWLIQVLKNSMTWYFLTFRSLSSKLVAWVSGVSGEKGKDGSKKGRELKERNAWHRCFYWSLPA